MVVLLGYIELIESVEASAGVYPGLLVILSRDGLKSPVLTSASSRGPCLLAGPTPRWPFVVRP